MKRPLIAIPSFPGSNGEVDNMKMFRRIGCDSFVFRWNDSLEKLHNVDGYFFGAGFSYEDRGRSGMVAARDPLFQWMHEEAARGKVILGNCNGAQVLIESGLIPMGDGLRMCLAHNTQQHGDTIYSPGFLNEWIWMTPVCKKDRCATSNWSGALHIPIAHGEGRFVTRDPDLIQELQGNDQIAFCYSTADGHISADYPITPNGSTLGIAGICNPQGNVVAIMPHPERTEAGDPYFLSMKEWILTRGKTPFSPSASNSHHQSAPLASRLPMADELFIGTIITNNEERTVERAAQRVVPDISMTQYSYYGFTSHRSEELLSKLSFFNAQKEKAYIRRNDQWYAWNAEKKTLAPLSKPLMKGYAILRRDEPDTRGISLGDGSQTGVCYDCMHIGKENLQNPSLQAVFGNPHASSLSLIS